MKLREKKNLKSFKEPTIDDVDEDMASEQDDENYTGDEIISSDDEAAMSSGASASEDPEADYRSFSSQLPTKRPSSKKSSNKNSSSATTKKKAAQTSSKAKSQNAKSSSSHMSKSEYFNRDDGEDDSQEPPKLLKVKKAPTKTKTASLETNVGDLLAKMENDHDHDDDDDDDDDDNTAKKVTKAKKKPAASRATKKKPPPGKKKPIDENATDESSDEDDWEEVRMEHQVNVSAIGLNSVEVVINERGAVKKSKSSDPRAKYERMIKALRKKFSIAALKTHLLCWLAHGFYLNRMCLGHRGDEGQLLAALALSLSSKLCSAQRVLSRSQSSSTTTTTATVSLKSLKSYLKSVNDVLAASVGDLESSGGGCEVITPEVMCRVVGDEQFKFASYLQYVLLVVALLRNAGVKTRLCVCFECIDPKEFVESLSNASSSAKRRQLIKSEKSAKSGIVDNNNNTDTKNDDQVKSEESQSSKKPLFKNKPMKRNNQILSIDEEDEETTIADDNDDDSKESFERKWNSSRFYWIECYLDPNNDDDDDSDEQKSSEKENECRWFAIEPLSNRFDCVKHLEERFGKRVLYVCAFDDDNRVKDVTKRYASEWTTKTRLLRVTHLEDKKLWWERTLMFHQPLDASLDIQEEKQLKKTLLEQPLPVSVSDFKDHPLYVLPRHLLKFQSIYPQNPTPVTHLKDEPVYSRDHLVTLHSRQTWLKFARVVKPFEKPYKIVKGRIKQSEYKQGVRQNPDLDLYGYWQTKEYDPPYAENGRVPRNEFGNVELFQPRMLPHGCVHLRGMPNLNRVCRKLKLDCAAAVTGFDAHGGFSHAVYDGWVVCAEHRDLIVDAYRQEEIEARKRAIEKNAERILGNWKKLIQGVLIRERLKAKYDGAGAGSDNKRKITNKMLEEMGTAIANAAEAPKTKKAAARADAGKQEPVELKEETKFTGNQEVVGAKLNCHDEKVETADAECKSALIINPAAVDVAVATTLSSAVAMRTTRAASKRAGQQSKKTTKPVEEKPEPVVKEEKKVLIIKPSKPSRRKANKKDTKEDPDEMMNCEQDKNEEMEEVEAEENDNVDDDDDYKPERKKRTSGSRRNGKGKVSAKAESSSSESDDDEPPIKRRVKAAQGAKSQAQNTKQLMPERVDDSKPPPTKVYKFEDDGELKLSESEDDDDNAV